MSPRILQYSDIENAADDPERIGRLAGLIDRVRDERTLVVGTGDNTSPGVLSLVTEGEHSLAFFEAVDPDLETPGNHDFDYGPDRTEELIERSPQTWLTANVRRNGGRFGAGVGTKPWAIRERAGARIGCFGLTDPTTPSINPNAMDLTVTDPVDAARDAVAELRERDVDYLVALSHLGSTDEQLAEELDIDVILGGHIHTPTVDHVAGTLLTRPGVNGQRILTVDLGGSTPTATFHDVADGPVDQDVADETRDLMAAADLDETLANVADPIPRTAPTVFQGETRIGNFVADAYRWATGADVGLQNSGGIRSGDPLAGAVTVADLISVVPFGEPVVVVEVSGAELMTVFEQASGAAVAFGEPGWWHAHLSGARVVYDRTDHTVVEATVDGDPVDPGSTYTVATSEYIVYTDHEFPVITADKCLDGNGIQYEVLADYARLHGIDPDIEGRIVRTG